MQKWVSFHCKNMTANIYIFVVMFLISPCVLMKHRVLTFYSSYFMNNFNTTYFYQTHLTNYKTYRYDNWSRINITTNLFTSNIYQTPKWWHFHYFQLCHGFQTMFAFIFPLVLRCLVGASFLHSKVYTVLALKKGFGLFCCSIFIWFWFPFYFHFSKIKVCFAFVTLFRFHCSCMFMMHLCCWIIYMFMELYL